MNTYLCLATVTVKAPVNYKPRVSTYTLACRNEKNSSSFRKRVEKEALEFVRESYTKVNPDLELKYSVTSKITKVFGICDYEDLKKI